jgi:hypothetical protein
VLRTVVRRFDGSFLVCVPRAEFKRITAFPPKSLFLTLETL